MKQDRLIVKTIFREPFIRCSEMEQINQFVWTMHEQDDLY